MICDSIVGDSVGREDVRCHPAAPRLCPHPRDLAEGPGCAGLRTCGHGSLSSRHTSWQRARSEASSLLSTSPTRYGGSAKSAMLGSGPRLPDARNPPASFAVHSFRPVDRPRHLAEAEVVPTQPTHWLRHFSEFGAPTHPVTSGEVQLN